MRETRKEIAKQSGDKRIMICQCLRLLQPARDRRREGGVRACCLHIRQVCSPCVPQGSIASRWCSARWSVALPLAKVACADEADAWRGFQGVLVRYGRIVALHGRVSLFGVCKKDFCSSYAPNIAIHECLCWKISSSQ
jgi:hypothetical protein